MTAVLCLHIVAALSGIGLSFRAFFKPSHPTIRFSYTAIVLTLISGTYLVATGRGQMTSSCLGGILYVGLVSSMLIPAKRRLARQAID